MKYELGVNKGNIFVTQIQRKLCANKQNSKGNICKTFTNRFNGNIYLQKINRML